MAKIGGRIPICNFKFLKIKFPQNSGDFFCPKKSQNSELAYPHPPSEVFLSPPGLLLKFLVILKVQFLWFLWPGLAQWLVFIHIRSWKVFCIYFNLC